MYQGRADMLCPGSNRRFLPSTEIAVLSDKPSQRDSAHGSVAARGRVLQMFSASPDPLHRLAAEVSATPFGD